MGDKPRMRGVVLATVAVAAGCADRDAEAPVAPIRATPSGPTRLPAQPEEPPQRPRLRSPGAEPRRELRYRPVVGTTRELELRTKVGMQLMSGDHPIYSQNTESRGRIKLQVAAVRDGAITIDLEVLEMHEPTYEPTQAGRVQLDGLKGSFTIDDRGVLVSQSPSLETGPVREYLYIVDYLHPLPTEPVGAGAVWDVETSTPRTGISMTTMQTFRVVSIDGARIVTRATETYVAPPQIVPHFEFDALSLFENASISGEAATENEVALDWPYPLRTESRFEFGNDMFIHHPSRPRQPVRLTMNATMSAALK